MTHEPKSTLTTPEGETFKLTEAELRQFDQIRPRLRPEGDPLEDQIEPFDLGPSDE